MPVSRGGGGALTALQWACTALLLNIQFAPSLSGCLSPAPRRPPYAPLWFTFTNKLSFLQRGLRERCVRGCACMRWGVQAPQGVGALKHRTHHGSRWDTPPNPHLMEHRRVEGGEGTLRWQQPGSTAAILGSNGTTYDGERCGLPTGARAHRHMCGPVGDWQFGKGRKNTARVRNWAPGGSCKNSQ